MHCLGNIPDVQPILRMAPSLYTSNGTDLELILHTNEGISPVASIYLSMDSWIDSMLVGSCLPELLFLVYFLSTDACLE